MIPQASLAAANHVTKFPAAKMRTVLSQQGCFVAANSTVSLHTLCVCVCVVVVFVLFCFWGGGGYYTLSVLFSQCLLSD